MQGIQVCVFMSLCVCARVCVSVSACFQNLLFKFKYTFKNK